MKKRQGQKSPMAGALGPRPGLPARRLSPSTHKTLELLRRQAKPVELAVLTQLAALHPNTVRQHLDVLVGARLASRRREPPHRRGRPAWLYQATPVTSGVTEYTELTTALAAALTRTSPYPGADAELAGEDWGHDLARHRGAAQTTGSVARDHAIAILDDLGFAPRQDDPADPALVRLTRCPFLDTARQNPRIICSLHLGMLRGVLSGYGADPTGSDLAPFAEPGSCLLLIPPLTSTV